MGDLPKRDELFRRWRTASLAVPGTRISVSAIDTAGTDANLLAAATSLVGDEIVSRGALALSGCFERTASGDRLDRVILDRKGLARKPASPAVGRVTLTRPAATAGSGTLPGGPPGIVANPTTIRTNTGVEYFFLEPAVFGPTSLGPVTVSVQAQLPGLQSQVSAGQGWVFGQAPFDFTLQVENSEDMAGGADLESDDEYRARSRLFFRSLRRGTLEAIELGALSVPGVSQVAVQESVNPSGLPDCFVQVYILDRLGRANTQLAIRTQLALAQYRAAGIPLVVSAGDVDFVQVEIVNAAFDAAIVDDTTDVIDRVKLAIIAALNNQKPGEELKRGTIIAAARTVPGFLLDDSDLVEPAITLVPGATSTALRARKSLISIS